LCDVRIRQHNAHIETPTLQSQLSAKGVGEAGTAGAPAAIMNAINDALAPLNARVTATTKGRRAPVLT
jgi:CO/xanthine dehydrogenase Mo-binding subunit